MKIVRTGEGGTDGAVADDRSEDDAFLSREAAFGFADNSRF